MPLVAGVVATSELAASAGRLGMVVPRDPRPELRRVAIATAIAAAASGAALAVSGLPGPDGLVATVAGAAGLALAAVALRLAGRARDRAEGRGDTVAP